MSDVRARQIKLLENYYWNSRYLHVAHARAEAVHRRAGKCSNFFQALVPLIVGALEIIAFNAGGKDAAFGPLMAGIALSFVAGVIGLLRINLQFDAKLAKHHAAAMMFRDVATDIQLFRTGEMVDLEAFVSRACGVLDAHALAATSVCARYVEDAKKSLAHLPHTASESEG